MATPALERPVPPSLLLRPIRARPASERTSGTATDAVDALARRSQSWFGYPQDLPGRVTGALWTALVGAVAVGGWLVAVAPSTGLVYRIVTLGHPRLLLVLAAVCAATLLVLAPFTRGLTRAGGPELVVMVVGAIAGAGSLIGVVALALLTMMAAFLTVAAVVAIFE
jgi:hypothetical protein